MKEFSITSHGSKWFGKELNPNRIDSYYIRAKSAKRAVDILKEKGVQNMSYYHFNQYACKRWGTRINRPEYQGEGLWFIQDYGDEDLIEIWTDKTNV